MKPKLKEKSLVLLTILLNVMVFSGLCYLCDVATAAPPDIKIAVVYPLSGPMARNGNLVVLGATAAMKWVNDNGGIKSLGGAKMVPVIADTGVTVERAASAMERICADPDIVMAMGSWASTLTMATTEVTERLGIPQFSISFSDALTARGYKWGFYVTPPSSVQTDLGLDNVINLARSKGHELKTAMLIGDNQLASKAYLDGAKKKFSFTGIQVIGEEIWTMGTLTDPTPIMQKVKKLNPDIIAYMGIAYSEAQLCLMKKKELGIRIPFVCNGGWAVDPAFRQFGPEVLEGLIAFSPMYPTKHTPQEWITRSLEECRKKYPDEPWMGQDLGYAWGMVPIMAEILERASSTNRKVIREVAHKLELHDVMATRQLPKQGIAFDEQGRIAKKYQGVVFVQWQGAVPRTVFPPEVAERAPIWVSK